MAGGLPSTSVKSAKPASASAAPKPKQGLSLPKYLVELVANTAATQSAPITTQSIVLGTPGNTGNYTLTTPANNAKQFTATTTGNVAYTDVDGLDLGPVTIGGTFNLIANGAITDSLPVVVTGLTTITTGAANDMTLDNAGNKSAAKMAIIAMTTSSSIMVNPRFQKLDRVGKQSPF